MKRFIVGSLLMLVATSLLTLSASAQSKRSVDLVTNDATEANPELSADKFSQRRGDYFQTPDTIKAFAQRQEALKQRLAGNGSGKVHQIAKGQYVELQLERSDRIFAILVEYGDKPSSVATLPSAPGPYHNQIAQPNRAVDNSTAWQPDFSSAYYNNILNVELPDYYQKQSSGRYVVNGLVTEWVRVPFNGARYGSNSSTDGSNTPYAGDPGAWTLIADAINIWTNDQLAQGKTMDEIKAYLKTFDKWDRYDYNHNGNFDEPDGYIDHFMIIYAGEGEEAGGGTLGSNAIWSHSWSAWYNLAGVVGPDFNKNGGVEFGGGWGANPSGSLYRSPNGSIYPLTNANSACATVVNAHPENHTGIWVRNYTIEPENGGLGVFAHEFGHDLGLPDHYDTSNTGNNSAGFWNIMASGSWLGDGTEDIGTKPDDMIAWDKLQLGWLNYDVAIAGKYSTHRLGPAETNTKAAQGLVVILPPEKNVKYTYNPAGNGPNGTYGWWGGAGDLIDNTMTRQVSVPAGSPYLTMNMVYAIESGWDYAYVEVSTDGVTWTPLPGQYQRTDGTWANLTTMSNPNGMNLGNGITGTTSGAWRSSRFSMAAYAGQTVSLRFRYKTDDYTFLSGILIDDIALGSFTDGAENGANGWTLAGFKASTGAESSNKAHYYIAEYRQYRTYDTTLQVGPYTYGYADYPDMVAHYPYQDGLLITYWDMGEADDNSPQHPGEGRSLPIDAHPDPLLRYVNFPNSTPYYSPWSSTVQSYDSTFSLEPTDAIDLPFRGTYNGAPYQFWQHHSSLPGVPVFNDLNSYWSKDIPTASVIVPKTGTVIRIVNTNTQGDFMQVNVEPAK